MAQPDPVPQPLILPLGHYIGAYHAGDGAPLSYHTVRIGRQPVRLRSDAELTIWGLAHGGEEDPSGPWTRDDVLALAEQADIPDAAEILDELIEEDIVIEVRPGTEDAVHFAEAHRVMPLLFGLGPGGPDNALRRIGFGARTAVEADSFAFELWRFGRLTDDLWTFLDLYGEALRRAGGASEAETTPDRLLAPALHEIQILLGRHAAYLDVSPALWD